MNTNYLEKYLNTSWEMNMYLSGLKDKVDWEQSKWTPNDIRKAVKYFNSIALPITKETIVYRGTTMSSPLMLELQAELPGPGKEKLGQVVSTTYNKSIAEEFTGSKKVKVKYLHILKLQPGVKIIDMVKQFEGCDKHKVCLREQEVLSARAPTPKVF